MQDVDFNLARALLGTERLELREDFGRKGPMGSCRRRGVQEL